MSKRLYSLEVLVLTENQATTTVSYSTGPCQHLVEFNIALMQWHRVVPDFLVQTGDKTGTGAGGESFYGGTLNKIHIYIDFALIIS